MTFEDEPIMKDVENATPLPTQAPQPLQVDSRKPSTGVPSHAHPGPPAARSAQPPRGNAQGAQPPQSRSQRREKNKFYKDVDATGKWGNISRKEVYVVLAIVSVIVIAVIVGVVVLIVSSSEDSPAVTPRTSVPTISPTSGTRVPAALQLSAIRKAVQNNTFAGTNLALLPETVASYRPEASDPTAHPLLRAASWIMFVDPMSLDPSDPWFIPRYVLVMLYYSFEGQGWTNQTGWLTDTHSCTWFGVNCDRLNTALREIDLGDNNLVGTIPSEINMMSDLRSLWLRNNQINGSIPHLAIGSIPELTILYLENNQLTGQMSEDLRANGVLNTIFVQRNQLTGRWPRRWCPKTGDPAILLNFGLDCDELPCSPSCCLPDNCY